MGEGGDGNVVCPNGIGIKGEVELGVANGVAYLNVIVALALFKCIGIEHSALTGDANALGVVGNVDVIKRAAIPKSFFVHKIKNAIEIRDNVLGVCFVIHRECDGRNAKTCRLKNCANRAGICNIMAEVEAFVDARNDKIVFFLKSHNANGIDVPAVLPNFSISIRIFSGVSPIPLPVASILRKLA